VPWHYVRILLVVVVALAALVIVLLTKGNLLWLLFFLIVGGLTASIWYLSRLIDLKQIGPELTPEEGVLDTKQLQLELEEAERTAQEAKERQRFRRSVCILLTMGLVMVFLVVFWLMT
jgi:hypothetical protein